MAPGQPLPFRDASRLVFVWADQTAEGYRLMDDREALKVMIRP